MDISLLNELGIIYISKYKDLKTGEEFFQRILEIDNNNRRALLNLGILYMCEYNNYIKAKEYLYKVYENYPEDIILLNSLAYLNLFVDINKSEEYLIKALDLEPNNNNTITNLGNLYMEHIINHKLSEKCYLKVLELDPENEIAYNNLMILYSKKYKRED
jgi:tetratricopeptide (TPR) repeat protein